MAKNQPKSIPAAKPVVKPTVTTVKSTAKSTQNSSWLIMPGSQNTQLLFDKTKPPIAKSPKPKPLTLFINSHFKNIGLFMKKK